MAGIFAETARCIRKSCPGASFVMPLPAHASPPPLPPFVEPSSEGIHAVRDAQAVLTKSGTVTLELALMGVPMVVAHRLHPLTHAIARRRINAIPFIALPNILSGRNAVPEYRQDLDPEILCQALLSAGKTDTDLSAAGSGGAVENAVEAMLSSG